MKQPRFLCVSVVIIALCVSAQAPSKAPTLIYMGALPGKILVLDEAQEKVIGEIPLHGIPRNLSLSLDKKTIFVYTLKDSGIEVVDLATRKVTNHFILNEGDRRIALYGFAPDPQGRFIYGSATARVKKADRFELEKPKFVVIDLAQKKITKTVDYPKDDDGPHSVFGGFRVSPDGKFLYVFRDNVYIYDTTDFKQVEKIELSKPQSLNPWMETVNVGPGEDPHDEPGVITALFNSTDPIVRRSIFGIARFDLVKRTFDFTPVGPSTQGMAGLRLTPDRKTGYTVAFQGSLGNRRSEFWVFDMDSRRIANRVEFAGPINFRFAISGSGKHLYIYGTAPTLEIYDAATLKMRKTIDLNADVTTGIVVVPGG